MSHRRRPVPRALRWSAALLCGAVAAAASADVLELKNGRRLEGEVVEEVGDRITVRVDGGVVTFPRDMVAKIHRDADGAAATGGDGAATAGDEPAAQRRPSRVRSTAGLAADEWFLLLAGGRRVGWRRCQARVADGVHLFEEESVFLDAEGKIEARTRLVEEAGPDLYPLGFDFREEAAGRETRRRGRMVDGRLQVTVSSAGRDSESDLAVPAGFRLPLAARRFVLQEAEGLPGGWRGTTWDPRTGAFQEIALKVTHRERIPWEGEARNVTVLVRTKGLVREEERVDDAGAALTADLNGPSLVAVRTTKERAEAVGAGRALDITVEEVRAQSVFVSDAHGFRILKPGVAWEFVPGETGSGTCVTVKDVGGLAYVTVTVEAAAEGSTVAGLGATLERTWASRSAEFRRIEDGFVRIGDVEAFRLLCEAKVKGDRVRSLGLVALHRGRVWTLAATAPASDWEEAAPYLERILAAFEWL